MFPAPGKWPKHNAARRDRIRNRYELAKDRYLAALVDNKFTYEPKLIEYNLMEDETAPDEYGHSYPAFGGRFAKSYDEIPKNGIVVRSIDKFSFIEAFYKGWKRKYGAGNLG